MRFRDNVPIYQQIADDIKALIISEKLKSDDKLLSVREYMGHYSVTALTMQRALAVLEQEGVIYTKKGIGSFVAQDIQVALKNTSIDFVVTEFIDKMRAMGLSDQEMCEKINAALSVKISRGK